MLKNKIKTIENALYLPKAFIFLGFFFIWQRALSQTDFNVVHLMLKKKNSEQQESSYPWKLEFADSKFNSAYEVLT